MSIHVEIRDRVAIITMANGAVNALSIANGHVSEVARGLNEALADDSCDTIVITGAGRMFCGGADLTDFDTNPELLDLLRTLLSSVEASPKQVVMAIHGVALGGGLELALAGHSRIAARGTKLGLPEVTLGLLPGAGGTQRLPRLIGTAEALDLMLTGKPVSVERAVEIGLVDHIVEESEDLVDNVIRLIGSDDLRFRRTGTLPVPQDKYEAIAAVRTMRLGRSLNEAPERIIECTDALSADLAAGLEFESRSFGELIGSEISRGLRHAFFGERAVARIPGLPAGVQPRPFNQVGVVGGGTMGTGIAIALLAAGLIVTIVEPREEGLRKAEETIRATIMREVEKGRLSQSAAVERLAALFTAGSLDALAKVDLVIEAVFEDMAVKASVFGELERITRPSTILASNTSTLDLNTIAGFVSDPTRVVGLHFFSPANIMRLLEIVRGAATAPDVLATAVAFGKRVGKVGVVSGVCDGFIGNRIFEEYLRQTWFMLEEGALPQQIDGAMERWGMAMGPCRTMDLVGQDIGWAIRKRRTTERPDRPYADVINRICELGRFGQKTGKGIYCYPDGRTPVPDEAVEALIVNHSAEMGVDRRTITDAEIVERCLFAMINEGARIVEEGIAYRPVDVDVIMMHGYGLARERGGPMFQADLFGPTAVLERLRSWEQGPNGWAWETAPLIERLAASGGRFADLNG